MVVIAADGRYRLKIVLYGPSLSGKTEILNALRRMFLGAKSKLYSIQETNGRTLFFDYLVIRPASNVNFVFDLYTVPGQRRHAKQRRVILNGADGIVFVADSSPIALYENARSFEELKFYLGGMLDKIPLIIAINKRDLAEALPIRLILNSLKISKPVPVFPTIATTGKGLKELFRETFRLTMLASFFPAIYKKELARIIEIYKHLLPEELLKKPLIKRL